MGGSSGSEPRAPPMISASETMSSAIASGGGIPNGSSASAVMAAGCHGESCGPSSGAMSSGGTTTRGYSSLNGSSNIGEPWRYQGSSGSLPGSLPSSVIGESVSSRVLSSLLVSSCLRTPVTTNQTPAAQASARIPETMSTTYPAGYDPSATRARASGPLRRQGQLGACRAGRPPPPARRRRRGWRAHTRRPPRASASMQNTERRSRRRALARLATPGREVGHERRFYRTDYIFNI